MQGEVTVSQLPLTGNLSVLGVEYFAQRYLRGAFIKSGSIKSSHSILENNRSAILVLQLLQVWSQLLECKEIKGRSITHSCLK